MMFSIGNNIFKVLLVCLATVLGIVFYSWLTDKNLSVEDTNIKMAEKVMDKLPKKISDTVTWETIKADKKTMIYGYKFSLDLDQINVKVTEQAFQKDIKTSLCKGEHLARMRLGTIFKYTYTSADQKKVFDVIVREENCK